MLVYNSEHEFPPRSHLMPFWFEPTDDEPFPTSKGTILIYIATWDSSIEDFRWADDEVAGKYPLRPSVDLVYQIHEFITENEARAFIKEWWAAGE